jgi:hypothetical protein
MCSLHSKSEQRLNGIAISRGGCDVPAKGYACAPRERKKILRRARAMSTNLVLLTRAAIRDGDLCRLQILRTDKRTSSPCN